MWTSWALAQLSVLQEEIETRESARSGEPKSANLYISYAFWRFLKFFAAFIIELSGNDAICYSYTRPVLPGLATFRQSGYF